MKKKIVSVERFFILFQIFEKQKKKKINIILVFNFDFAFFVCLKTINTWNIKIKIKNIGDDSN